MEKAIASLAENQELFSASEMLPTMYTSEINTCLSIDGSFDLLNRMARDGSVPIKDYNSEAVKTIAELDLGGVVSRQNAVNGMPRSVWEHTNCEYGLVPTSNSMRLVIAKRVALRKRQKGWRRFLFWRRIDADE